LVEPLQDAENSDTTLAQGASARTRPISVDQIRQLGELLALTGYREAGRVLVIHPAENMNAAAANALLKNLEEPPARTLFLLVTHRPALLPPTIRSRCQAVLIKLEDGDSAEAWLRMQGVENAAQELALCGGAPLEAAAVVSDPAWGRRRDLLSGLCAEGSDGVALAARFRELAPGIILSWLQKWTFDLLLLHFCGRARYHRDLEAIAAKFASTVDPASVVRLHRRLLAMQKHIHHPLNPRLLIEQMLIDCRQVLLGSKGPLG
jgi:DNA polymerase-3 subunit delta'